MELGLSDKLALVSGSTKGIGHAIATGLAGEGARVIITGRSESTVGESIASIRNQFPAANLKGFAGDLSDPAWIEELVRQHPTVDILVNSLGVFNPKRFEHISDEDWASIFDINVMSGVRLSRAYLPLMKQANWGRIVFISSESAVQIPVEMIHYGVTKTAQVALSRGLAESCAGTGVTVNAVLPGPTRSAGLEEMAAKVLKGDTFEDFQNRFFKSARPSSLLRRFATTREIANLVVYVCSEASSATNGAALRVDGGVIRSVF
jgi:NAD(P)-dependent dehydrogenase (short-subunit alcohol dehydrogenase family)